MTNRDITEKYSRSDQTFIIGLTDFIGSFAKFVAKQGLENFNNIDKATDEYKIFLLNTLFENNEHFIDISYSKINEYTSVELFEKLPNVLKLNETENDFIDLGALSRNVFYDIIREGIGNNEL